MGRYTSMLREKLVAGLLAVPCPEPGCTAAAGTTCGPSGFAGYAELGNGLRAHDARMAAAVTGGTVSHGQLIAQFAGKAPAAVLSAAGPAAPAPAPPAAPCRCGCGEGGAGRGGFASRACRARHQRARGLISSAPRRKEARA